MHWFWLDIGSNIDQHHGAREGWNRNGNAWSHHIWNATHVHLRRAHHGAGVARAHNGVQSIFIFWAGVLGHHNHARVALGTNRFNRGLIHANHFGGCDNRQALV